MYQSRFHECSSIVRWEKLIQKSRSLRKMMIINWHSKRKQYFGCGNCDAIRLINRIANDTQLNSVPRQYSYHTWPARRFSILSNVYAGAIQFSLYVRFLPIEAPTSNVGANKLLFLSC